MQDDDVSASAETTVPSSEPGSTPSSAPGSPSSAAPGSADGSAPAATTTTVQPQRPTSEDIALLVEAQGMEWEFAAALDKLVAAGTLDLDHLAPVAVIRDAHLAHAQGLGAVLGKSSTSAAGSVFAGSVGALDPAQPAGARDAFAKSYDQLIATYAEMLPKLHSTSAVQLVNSIAMSLGQAQVTLDAAFATAGGGAGGPGASTTVAPTTTTEVGK